MKINNLTSVEELSLSVNWEAREQQNWQYSLVYLHLPGYFFQCFFEQGDIFISPRWWVDISVKGDKHSSCGKNTHPVAHGGDINCALGDSYMY